MCWVSTNTEVLIMSAKAAKSATLSYENNLPLLILASVFRFLSSCWAAHKNTEEFYLTVYRRISANSA